MTPARRRHLAFMAVFTDPVVRDRTAICSRISNAVGASERRFQRMLGTEWTDAYRADWDTAAETYDMLMAPARPDVLPRFRPMAPTLSPVDYERFRLAGAFAGVSNAQDL